MSLDTKDFFVKNISHWSKGVVIVFNSNVNGEQSSAKDCMNLLAPYILQFVMQTVEIM